jgi:hypothetical protein
MTEPDLKPSSTETDTRNEIEEFPLHTCACGEQHRHRIGGPSQRETCKSPKKNTDSCCCGSGHDPQRNHHRCGHGRPQE